MRTQIRIVAGSLRGRKVSCTVTPQLRPTPQMVREALFSILGNAVPGRVFYDVFAGTGVVGIEALSRGAKSTIFLERDFRLSGDIEQHLRQFGIAEGGRILRTDAYRWAEYWKAPEEPVNIFVSPPFPDYEKRIDEFHQFVTMLQQKAALGSVLVLQTEHCIPLDQLPLREQWEDRKYGRNHLMIWVKEAPVHDEADLAETEPAAAAEASER